MVCIRDVALLLPFDSFLFLPGFVIGRPNGPIFLSVGILPDAFRDISGFLVSWGKIQMDRLIQIVIEDFPLAMKLTTP